MRIFSLPLLLNVNKKWWKVWVLGLLLILFLFFYIVFILLHCFFHTAEGENLWLCRRKKQGGVLVKPTNINYSTCGHIYCNHYLLCLQPTQYLRPWCSFWNQKNRNSLSGFLSSWTKLCNFLQILQHYWFIYST